MAELFDAEGLPEGPESCETCEGRLEYVPHLGAWLTESERDAHEREMRTLLAQRS